MSQQSSNYLSRRAFLKAGTCGAMTIGPLVNSIAQLSLINTASANTAYDIVDEYMGVDQANGAVFNTISVFKQDTQVTDNTQLTYEVSGKVQVQSASDIRPLDYTTLSVMEIGV